MAGYRGTSALRAGRRWPADALIEGPGRTSHPAGPRPVTGRRRIAAQPVRRQRVLPPFQVV